MRPAPRGGSYRPDIDGLRALAVLSVIAFHAWSGLLPGGFIGVDVFFVISGFLISTIIFKGLEESRFSFGDFYARRIRRIFPALVLVLSCVWAGGWFLLLADEYKKLGEHIAYTAGFILNINLFRESGYFEAAAATKPLLHLWSLGIEEQYYLIWPFLAFIAWRLRFSLLHLTLGMMVISFILNIGRIGDHSAEVFYLPHARFWELLMGSVLAYIELHRKESFDALLTADILPAPTREGWLSLANAKAMLGSALFVSALFAPYPAGAFPGWWALLPTFGSFLLISAGDSSWINRKVLSNHWLVSIGLISYPLYLWHWPLLVFARLAEAGEPRTGIVLAALALSFVLAWLTYQFIEKPIRIGPRNVFVPAALFALLGVIGGVGIATYHKDGFGFRLKAYEERLKNFDKQAYRGGAFDEACRARFKSKLLFNYCKSNSKSPPSIAVIGDSHAHAIYDGLIAKWGGKKSVILLASSGCPPLLNTRVYQAGSDRNACNRGYAQILRFLEHSTVRHIYLTGRGEFYLASEMGFMVERGKTRSTRESYQLGMRDMLTALMGKYDVKYVLEQPSYRVKYSDCFRPFSTRTGCTLTLSQMENDEYSRRYREVMQTLKDSPLRFSLLDPTPYFCAARECRQIIDGKLLYADTHHLSQDGGQELVSYFSRVGLIDPK